ncbi:Rieske 2Fe-2S domain-containing protein [Hydrogenophaga sp.]|uniref:Rieske 2Fe-2S domain-containing protein n=1 Tax=Hydrogenophaga sp. TaxID=1904254 RepID=UPI003569AF1B
MKTIPIHDVSRLQGSAYHHAPAHPDDTLVGVGKGTQAGEYLRRYWHPIGVAAEVTSRPQMVRLLGEDLVLFRDKAGRPGLLYPRCMHRGTSLYFGRVEEEGIRCCYHGWLFSVEGHCLNQPCEPDGGQHRDTARQPWYPVEERYGLVFAYMGPPEKKPVLPRYDILEDLEEGEFIEVNGSGFAGFADDVKDPHVPYHWLQNWENIVDPYHVHVLHATFSGIQFAEGFKILPKVDFEPVESGVIYHAYREFEDGRSMDRINSALLPNISAIPDIDLAPGRGSWVGWHVAVDDTHFRGFFAARTRKPGRFAPFKMHNGKSWLELSEQERQDFPGDFEAQGGQGAITLHSEEHLATSDRGIGLLRRMMKKQIATVAEGGDPLGVHFHEEQALVKIRSGNFYTDPAPHETTTA